MSDLLQAAIASNLESLHFAGPELALTISILVIVAVDLIYSGEKRGLAFCVGDTLWLVCSPDMRCLVFSFKPAYAASKFENKVSPPQPGSCCADKLRWGVGFSRNE